MKPTGVCLNNNKYDIQQQATVTDLHAPYLLAILKSCYASKFSSNKGNSSIPLFKSQQSKLRSQ